MSQESRDIDLDGEVQDGEDPDIYDEHDPESMMEPEPELEPAPMMEPEPEPAPMMEPQSQEFKTITSVQYDEPELQQPEQPEQFEDDDVLFGDAPETRTKKVGYY